MKQNVTFQEKMHFENFRLNQIQNGRLSVTIYFHIADIWLKILHLSHVPGPCRLSLVPRDIIIGLLQNAVGIYM